MLVKEKKEILESLKVQNEREFYKNYITGSSIWYFTHVLNIPDNEHLKKLDIFKRVISESFSIELHDSQLVGSAKIGFSLSPEKFPNDFNFDNRNSSDLDIAIVSKDLFEKTWEYLKFYSSREYINVYPKISSSIFKGFVNDKHLQMQHGTFNLSLLKKIDDCSRDLRDEFSIMHPINYRIYYSWDDLERYSIEGIKKAKEVL